MGASGVALSIHSVVMFELIERKESDRFSVGPWCASAAAADYCSPALLSWADDDRTSCSLRWFWMRVSIQISTLLAG
ncbi:hypothetical protein T06_7232 [Trichinella sp. T6]|nr:hypothetical protein T06_7232 [Trichinella sp. T6]